MWLDFKKLWVVHYDENHWRVSNSKEEALYEVEQLKNNEDQKHLNWQVSNLEDFFDVIFEKALRKI